MDFAGKVALIASGTTGIGEAVVRLVASLGTCVGLLYGVSEEAESKGPCRLLWPWNKCVAIVSFPNEGRNQNVVRGRADCDRDEEGRGLQSPFAGTRKDTGEAI